MISNNEQIQYALRLLEKADNPDQGWTNERRRQVRLKAKRILALEGAAKRHALTYRGIKAQQKAYVDFKAGARFQCEYRSHELDAIEADEV